MTAENHFDLNLNTSEDAVAPIGVKKIEIDKWFKDSKGSTHLFVIAI